MMAKKPVKASSVTGKIGKTISVDAIKHKDSRVNIPTEELRDFVREDEASPTKLLYPRDPSVDPQLVWQGKDEQDRRSLSIPVVPIYIQEKIHPQALIENLRSASASLNADPEPSLFADFNESENFDERVDFYHHEGHWSNRMILGDSLLVMASVSEKEGLKGKVQCIYFDPPYGIKFGSNWQVSTRKRDVKDGKADDATRQPEQIRAFRDTWQVGVHSYLAYLRDRLILARELLTETGSLFVQIGDTNAHLVRSVLDEVFGSDGFCSQIAFKKTGGQSSALLPGVFDYLLWYAKDVSRVKYRQLFYDKEPGEEGAKQLLWVELPDGQRRAMTREEEAGRLPSGARVFQPYPLVSMGASATDRPFHWNGGLYRPSPGRHWSVTGPGLERLAWAGRLMAIGNTLRFVNYLADYPVTPFTNLWTDTQTSGFASDRVYVVQTLPEVVKRCLLMTTDPGDLVLDPTCGSGTTAYVAEQWGRRWITVDTSRVALALARTRLMTAKYPYYVLADGFDSPANTLANSERPPAKSVSGDIRKGFVYKRVPHVTLKSVANNPDINEGMSRDEINAAIVRHAETELLYDKPMKDKKRIRVTGPFTVESLSPHRVLAAADDRPASEIDGQRSYPPSQFEAVIVDNLRKAGVQNTKKGERLIFATLDLYPGTWINATGSFTDSAGTTHRVAVSIGPEHGTVGPMQIKEAAKEAVQGIGYDMLIVCGFAFDPHVSEEIKRYGSLTVLPTRMNPDLAMGADLLKKTGAGNLFMVFGEPDLDVRRTSDGKVIVTIRGLDVYDPTTGEIRSSSTDDIACWFIDTTYSGESFFVRHAYFTGAGEPYEGLKRALRADVDEATWRSLYSAVSRPFDKPDGGKIAVKVINHYGDEVLKVLEVS